MAGVKGRSGGPRPNSGGPRPGSGRKPKAKPQDDCADLLGAPMPGQSSIGIPATGKLVEPPEVLPKMDMLEFLRLVALGQVRASNMQVRAAIAAAQYDHTKKADGGKKEAKAEKAASIAAGGSKFSTRTGPRLVASK